MPPDQHADHETDRYVIFFRPGALAETAKIARNISGIVMPSSAEEVEFAVAGENNQDSDTLVIPSLGVAVTSADADQISRLAKDRVAPIRYIRKEYIFQIVTTPSEILPVSADYLRGYRDGVNGCIQNILNRSAEETEVGIQDESVFADTNSFTWGLSATGVSQSKFTGKGIRIAILDTGFDMNHPDFATRNIKSQSFIEGIATAQDDNGHGTHCLGTLAGPKLPTGQRRYGVACDAELFVGKVMNSAGKGKERNILNGIGWAIQNKCQIVSLSIGKPVGRGFAPDPGYEEIGAIALSQNCLIIAAAGNDSNRPGQIAPVNLPANSKTIMAVGAISRQSQMYNRSNGGINDNGGAIDLVGPGVDIFSSKRTVLSPPYGFDSGTSMATPHVAGIAALLMEADPAANAEQIWTRLTQSSKRLPLASTDVGSGLVQAPQ